MPVNAAQKTFDDYEADVLNTPIDDIEQAEYLIIKRKIDIESLESFISDKKDEMYITIESEYEDNKKDPFLSNADKRKIEAKKRLNKDDSFINASNDLYDLKETQMIAELRLSAMKRQYIREYCQNKLGV
jgi:hypothetical protein